MLKSDITSHVFFEIDQESVCSLIATDAYEHRDEDFFCDSKSAHLIYRLANEVKRLAKRVCALEKK